MKIVEISKLCIELQNAVNIQALARTWSEWMPAIREHATKEGIGLNDHPVNVMMASKFASLTGCEVPLEFSRAYDKVQEWSLQRQD